MDFWCWRGRAAETAAEAEAVEARDPGMVRLGDKSSGEAWVRGGWGQEARVRRQERGGQRQSWELGRMQVSPGRATARGTPVRAEESRAGKRRAGGGRQGRPEPGGGNQE